MNKTRKITLIGMFSALAYVFTLVGHFIPISFTDFLRYDPKDAIIVIAGLSLGCVPALVISVVVAFLELITISTTGIIGFAMNVLSSASFACVASLVYGKIRSIGGAAVGLTLSSALTVALMLLWNYLITPLYMGVPREVVEGMLLPIMLPFNVIKCGLNSALTMLIYKPCITALRKIGLIKSQGNEEKTKVKINPVAIILSIGVMAVMIVLFVTLKKS
ncbi:MAG: ECF transporter S component [Ruminococcaceae bacterium]|nr:ECF transporter S component [Oscillospiraceae bacterium]